MTDALDRKSLALANPIYVHRCIARFQDIDAAGIVFFARIFGYFHDGYLAFMADGGMPHADVLRGGVWGAPIRHAEADFHAPMRFGDNLEIGLVKAIWSGSLLRIGYRVAIAGGRVAATGVTEHVIVDFPNMSRIEPPPALRDLFRPLE
jgi:1,4-dihydroxy-2-naphthoyl-CoA hydrolase